MNLRSKVLVAFGLSFAALVPASGQEVAETANQTLVTDRQLAVLMFVDYGRSYGYQAMLAQIQIDTATAELARDRQILRQNEKLFAKNAVSRIELEISQLKVNWSEKQVAVAEKNLEAVSAQYAAMKQMAAHFAGVPVSRDDLYATFRRGWDAGCEKGPDEVAAMKAWVDYADKSLQRTRELSEQGSESLTTVLEKEAELATARANYEHRKLRLDRCREVLFPSLDDIRRLDTAR